MRWVTSKCQKLTPEEIEKLKQTAREKLGEGMKMYYLR